MVGAAHAHASEYLLEEIAHAAFASHVEAEALKWVASPATRAEGERMIAKSLTDIPEGRIREIAIERLKRIENGERDFRF
jgi:hypothetical protein